MDNYIKGETRVVDEPAPINADDNAVHMIVKAGSKIRNLMGYAMKKIKEPDINQVTWNASGLAVSKAVSCAEIMKRKIKNLHQITKIYFKREEDYWDPQVEGLERLCVSKNIPAIVILLSKKELDTAEPGYQAPGSFNALWKTEADSKKKGDQKKKKLRLSEPSTYDPPNMEKPKKMSKKNIKNPPSKDRGADQKLSGAERKQLKTARNDSVKAQTSKKQKIDNEQNEENDDEAKS